MSRLALGLNQLQANKHSAARYLSNSRKSTSPQTKRDHERIAVRKKQLATRSRELKVLVSCFIDYRRTGTQATKQKSIQPSSTLYDYRFLVAVTHKMKLSLFKQACKENLISKVKACYSFQTDTQLHQVVEAVGLIDTQAHNDVQQTDTYPHPLKASEYFEVETEFLSLGGPLDEVESLDEWLDLEQPILELFWEIAITELERTNYHAHVKGKATNTKVPPSSKDAEHNDEPEQDQAKFSTPQAKHKRK